jgi:hypothetical protein
MMNSIAGEGAKTYFAFATRADGTTQYFVYSAFKASFIVSSRIQWLSIPHFTGNEICQRAGTVLGR